MNRVEFIKQLERLLGDIPENDRQDALCYYNDYFDEAGVDNESQVIRELGSPEKVAATIKAELDRQEGEPVEYQECEFYEKQEETILDSTVDSKETKQKRSIPWPLVIIFVIFASPVLIGVGGGILGSVIGVIFSLIGVLFAAIICGVMFLAAGVVCLSVGIATAFFNPVEGLIMIGIGSLILALGILVAILSAWCVFRWIPAFVRWFVGLIKKLFKRGERGNQA